MTCDVQRKLPRNGVFALLHWSSNLLAVAGFGALAWCGVVLFQAFLYQEWASGYLNSAANGKQHLTKWAVLPPAKGALIGWIDIPRVGVSSAILQGTDASSLRLGVGHIDETVLPGALGNIGLAGPRDTFFRSLRRIRPRDEIILQTSTGFYRYAVEATRVVEPYDISVLQSCARSTLTLVTRYPFDFVGAAPRRFIVRATSKVSG